MRGVEPIRHTLTVPCGPDAAFDLFTAGMGSWWPLEAYSRAVSELADEDVVATALEFQARPGGLIVEHLSDGRTLPWGEVAGWDPARRVVMAWRPHSLPEPPTEVDVTFTAPGETGTEVHVEHRGWDRLSEGFRTAMYPIYVEGWPGTLARFASAAERAGLESMEGPDA